MFYFVRVNGETLHNNPGAPDFFVTNEPPQFPETRFNAVGFCLGKGIIRIGWPDTGDLRTRNRKGALANGYSLETQKLSVQRYLCTFRDIPVGSVVMMPDKGNPGDFYMGEVTQPYYYFHNLPSEPYEYSHRLGVKWDLSRESGFNVYRAADFGIDTQVGFWRRAFRAMEEYESSRAIVPLLKAARTKL